MAEGTKPSASSIAPIGNRRICARQHDPTGRFGAAYLGPRTSLQRRVEPFAPAGTGRRSGGTVQRVCERLLSVAFLPINAAPTAVPKVGLVTISVRTCADGDWLLTLEAV
ncbi:hypothetical protein OOZ63_17825 [Paucibacter sp. PLA-PC-4]|uniref:hypothetical protein n=1 Tax=Paucibacter sp. PLA-PC-4 TaxID=2993655 RepID=UPI00224AA0DF|nr:hypothetical protein [Paucibacter sp. PLA-PC-4]MCX2863691.1 hypothetical protein [Paucibacter sp. PLA-PC-4]